MKQPDKQAARLLAEIVSTTPITGFANPRLVRRTIKCVRVHYPNYDPDIDWPGCLGPAARRFPTRFNKGQQPGKDKA